MNITDYTVYWGNSAGVKTATSPVKRINKTGNDITSIIATGTAILAGTNAILIYSANLAGEMATPLIIPFKDKAIPVNNAVSVSFTDTDPTINQVSGPVSIAKAVNEDSSGIHDYVLYWGKDALTRLNGTAIGVFQKNNNDIVYSFSADTLLPVGATHLLVFTRNDDGEIAAPVAAVITDQADTTAPAVTITSTEPAITKKRYLHSDHI